MPQKGIPGAGRAGPGLKGKALLLEGLGALNCRLAPPAPHFGQADGASPRTRSSNFAPQAVQTKSNMGIETPPEHTPSHLLITTV
jgi:hypothetical protein